LRYSDFRLETAYRVAADVRRMREERGERPVGRKIGFTNQTVWGDLGIEAPAWSYMYHTTVFDLARIGASFRIAGFVEPRIEPEIVFGLARAPDPTDDEASLLASIEWVAHGFEVVNSIFPDWSFAAADAVAGFGVHAALLVGPRHSVSRSDVDWAAMLPAFAIELRGSGGLVERGFGRNVLGGPVSALRYLVKTLAADAENPPLAAGDVVTTGTLTRAMPAIAGEAWETSLAGVPLEGVSLRLA
jgi:2-oxo-3-hexenedioate decarboxylase